MSDIHRHPHLFQTRIIKNAKKRILDSINAKNRRNMHGYPYYMFYRILVMHIHFHLYYRGNGSHATI
jgi:hypothetical protein